MRKMYKWVINIIVIAIISVLISLSGLKITVNEAVMMTLYTVSGIMFSIGLGLIVSFNLTEVKNPIYLSKIRKNIKRVRDAFICYFICLTILFVIIQCLDDLRFSFLFFNFRVFVAITLLHSIIYYIHNFLLIQELNDDILDKINETK
ncbi:MULTISPECIES: hypothetical protein [unclassified Gilliamella]|uniref:hypothetical protein n=2 Tax=Gilliamella TaxID=1193503 RepID=UPI0018DD083B|nr:MULTISPECIES: hypothetical protein [unclassified Gilliamella]MBI0028543.1 hypothetical protein [Gilliamella sp. B14448G7]MBI0042514.1 hypothetical protein [Gilliamella sp. B14448G12]